MPYHVGEKWSYGCSGYPAVKDDGTVMGCHKTRAAAAGQIYAINQSEGNTEEKEIVATGPGGVGTKRPEEWPKMNKAEIMEGDFAIIGKKDEALVGQIIHIMREGVLGIPGADKTIEATAEDPAAMIRIFEQDDDGWWEPTDYFYGNKLSMFVRIDPLQLEPKITDMNKAEGYTPNAGMKAAARRALKWKEDGKATGAGTPVGWGRASDIVAGRPMSLSVVRRMYSFFSRHEVDKKGKDFYNTSNPSNGRIMWDAWGGDAGFAWSRAIVRRNEEKMLFSDFGKDYTKADRMVVTVETKKNVTPN